jgi:predicted HicB family RNase H-like nuclease
MSGIAAAKKRRANISPAVPDQPRLSNGGLAMPQQQQQTKGLTLQQVIELLNTRLLKVEKYINDSPQRQVSFEIQSNNGEEQERLPSNMAEILDDFQEKFVILAGEINTLKDTVLKLQSYTMEVNRTLLEERIQILSDLNDDNSSNKFTLENSPEAENENIQLEAADSTESIKQFIFNNIDTQ